MTGWELIDPLTGEIVTFRATKKDKESRDYKLLNDDEKISAKDRNSGFLRPGNSILPVKYRVLLEKSQESKARWARVDVAVSKELSQLDWTPKAIKTWFALLSKIKFGNRVYASRESLAEVSGLHVNRISEALAYLEGEDVIVRLAQGEYLVNPVMAWCGDEKARMTLAKTYYAAKHRAEKRAKKVKKQRDCITLVIDNGGN